MVRSWDSSFLEAARFAGTKDVLQGRLVDGGHEGHDGQDLQQLELESHPKFESYLVTYSLLKVQNSKQFSVDQF